MNGIISTSLNINKIKPSLVFMLFRGHIIARKKNVTLLSNSIAHNDTCLRGLRTSRNLLVSYVYNVTVKTGDKFGAGTDSNIFLRMIGTRGSTDEIMIETSKNELERGTIDHYNITSDDVGTLQKIIIRHDNSGFAPGWYLDWISISDGMGKKYNFKCDDWLIKDESFGNIKLLKEDNYLNGLIESPQQNINILGESNEIDEVVLSDLNDLNSLSGKKSDMKISNSTVFDFKDTVLKSHFVVNMMMLNNENNELLNVFDQIQTSEENNLKFNRIEQPHLILSTNCQIDNFVSYTKSLESKFHQFSKCVVLSKIFFEAMKETSDVFNIDETLDILVSHNGIDNIVCNDDKEVIYKQLNECNLDMVDVVIPKYGMNIIDTGSLRQLSQVLRGGQLLCLNIGAIRMGVDVDKELSKVFDISITCDSRFLSEAVCLSLLKNFKKYIVNPKLISG